MDFTNDMSLLTATAQHRKRGEKDMALHKLKIDEKGIWLDGMLLQGVRAYTVTHKENEDIDELTLLMDTTSSNMAAPIENESGRSEKDRR